MKMRKFEITIEMKSRDCEQCPLSNSDYDCELQDYDCGMYKQLTECPLREVYEEVTI